MTDSRIDIAPGLGGPFQAPHAATGLILLIDGSADPRERGRLAFVAGHLAQRRLATLVLHGEAPAQPLPDPAAAAGRLAHHLLQARDWARRDPRCARLPVGIFAAGAGVTAAILFAAERPRDVQALVLQGPPPDEAIEGLGRLGAPVLVAVGGLDLIALDQARDVLRDLVVERRLEVIPRATRRFEEAGAYDRLALAAADWFAHHLRPAAA